MTKTISHLKVVFLCFVIVLLTSCNPSSDFVYLSGKPGNLDDLKGRWVIVNFWAEWCAPCRSEVKILSDIVINKKISNISVIGISYDQLDVSELTKIVKEWQFGYPVVLTQPIPILPFPLPKQLPALYILSPELELVAKVSGEQNFESINKLLNSLRNKNN